MATWNDFIKRAFVPPLMYEPEVYRRGADNIAKATRDVDDALARAANRVSAPIERIMTGATGALANGAHEYFSQVGKGNMAPPSVNGAVPLGKTYPNTHEALKSISDVAGAGWRAGSDPINSRYAWHRVDNSIANILHGTVPGLFGLVSEDLGNSTEELFDHTPLGWLKRKTEEHLYGDGTPGNSGSFGAYLKANGYDDEESYYRSPEGLASEKAIAYSNIPLAFGIAGKAFPRTFGAVNEGANAVGSVFSRAATAMKAPAPAAWAASKAPHAAIGWKMFVDPYLESRKDLALSRKAVEEAERDKRLAQETSATLDEFDRARWLESEIGRPGPYRYDYKKPLLDELSELRRKQSGLRIPPEAIGMQ